MADYDGAILPELLAFERPDEIDVIRERTHIVATPYSVLASYGTIYSAGTLTLGGEVIVPSIDYDGAYMWSFFHDFYNRMFFIPPFINFGAVSGDTPRSLRIWNAFLEDVTLNTITETNTTGLELEGDTPPVTFQPLEMVDYIVRATEVGPPTIAATYTFIFDTPDSATDTYAVDITGQRAKVAPLPINWSDALQIEYQFKTDITTSRNGKEMRRALRTTPRKQVQYLATPSYEQFRTMNRLFASWHNNTILIPEVPRQVILADPLLSTDEVAVITQSPAPDWLVEDAMVVVAYQLQVEVRRVVSVVGTTVTFDGGGVEVFPAGAKLHPALAGRLAATISSQRETNQVARVTVVHEVTPASEPVIPLLDPDIEFNGREVFMKRFNWAGPPDVTYESLREVIDYGRGRTAVFTPRPFSVRTEKLLFLGRDYEEADELRQFFERMKGQRGEFYMPTWEPDIPLKVTAANGTRDLRIEGTAFYSEYKDTTVYLAVCLMMRNGNVFRSSVDSFTLVDDINGLDSVLTLTTDLPYEVDPDDVLMISWMPVWRHATDTLTIEWLTSAVAQCQMTVQTLEEL